MLINMHKDMNKIIYAWDKSKILRKMDIQRTKRNLWHENLIFKLKVKYELEVKLRKFPRNTASQQDIKYETT